MYKDKRVLAIIPARGGSKGLPGKNIKMLNGKPLLAWSILAAQKSRYLDEFMVSTEDEEIAEVAAEFGATVPFMRPVNLATDTTPSIDVVEHVLKEYETTFGKRFDVVVLLEPTSPLREMNDIDNVIAALIEAPQYQALVTLGKVKEHPAIVKRLDELSVTAYFDGEENNVRRQELREAYFPYGIAYATRTKALLEQRTFYCDKTMGYVVKPYQCYEVDDIFDFLAIEAVMKHQWGEACDFS